MEILKIFGKNKKNNIDLKTQVPNSAVTIDQYISNKQDIFKENSKKIKRKKDLQINKQDKVINLEKNNLMKEKEIINTTLEKKVVQFNNKEERKRYLNDLCEQILEAEKNISDAKIEYKAVTNYLTDMQKIDGIIANDSDEIIDTAKNINKLSNERKRYQSSDIKLTDMQYKTIEKYEDEVYKEIDLLLENEEILNSAKKDISLLENEKKKLFKEKKNSIENQTYLKKLSITTLILVVLLFGLFFTISQVFEMIVNIPYMMTIAMAGLSIFYIFYESRKNLVNSKLLDMKINKAIRLLNRVKIRYVNSTSLLEYAYNKYNIENAQDLQNKWEQYLKLKDIRRKYKDNTQLLKYYNTKLLKNLRNYNLIEPDIWIYQTEAIINKNEMVEIRHRLNERRKNLRERIEYNMNIKQTSFDDINQKKRQYPLYGEEIENTLKSYNII